MIMNKEQVNARILQFVQDIKEAMSWAKDDSSIIIRMSNGCLSLELMCCFQDQYNASLVNNKMLSLKDDLSNAGNDYFEVILKVVNRKLLIKNSLSPKVKEDPYNVIISILVKNDMSPLIPLVKDDVKYLYDILEHAATLSDNPDIKQLLTLINHL